MNQLNEALKIRHGGKITLIPFSPNLCTVKLKHWIMFFDTSAIDLIHDTRYMCARPLGLMGEKQWCRMVFQGANKWQNWPIRVIAFEFVRLSQNENDLVVVQNVQLEFRGWLKRNLIFWFPDFRSIIHQFIAMNLRKSPQPVQQPKNCNWRKRKTECLGPWRELHAIKIYGDNWGNYRIL